MRTVCPVLSQLNLNRGVKLKLKNFFSPCKRAEERSTIPALTNTCSTPRVSQTINTQVRSSWQWHTTHMKIKQTTEWLSGKTGKPCKQSRYGKVSDSKWQTWMNRNNLTEERKKYPPPQGLASEVEVEQVTHIWTSLWKQLRKLIKLGTYMLSKAWWNMAKNRDPILNI